MLDGFIYEVQPSFTYREQPLDRTHPALRRPEDDTHPLWGIALHFPAVREDEADPRNGDHWEIVPHVLLEQTAASFGFEHDDVSGIVDAVLHQSKIPDRWDQLAWQQPELAALQDAVRDLPDHLDPRMPYEERNQVVLARVEAAKTHLLTVTSAPQEDRQAALDARAELLRYAADLAEQNGAQLDPRYLVGLDDQAPDDPLTELTSAPLDPRRVATIRRRDEWILRTSNEAPRTFGMNRVVPPTAAVLAAALQAAPVRVPRGEVPVSRKPS